MVYTACGNFFESGAHYPGVRIGFIGISLGAHVAVVVALLGRPTPQPSADPAPLMAGETFELPAPPLMDAPLANASPSPDSVGTPAPADEGDAPARPTSPAHGRAAPRASHAGRPSAGRANGAAESDATPGSASTQALYGAVGDRSAAEVTALFPLAFRQTASGDRAWHTAPLGPAGTATIVVTLDPEGHIEDVQVLGSPSAALASSLRGTIALVKGRPFVAHSRVTKMEVTARISATDVQDSRFTIGIGTNHDGSAFVALPIGRRIDAQFRTR